MTERPTPTTFTRRGSAWCEVTPLAGGFFRLRVGGLLKTGWKAGLCNRLAEARISIDHMHARVSHDDAWIAELHVCPLDGAADPVTLPYIELSEDDDAPPSTELRLDSYRLIDSRDYGGSLMLTLEGPDKLGLLGSLLASMAQLSLYPVELHIETHGGRAYDSLWVRAAGGSVPSRETKDALEQVLAGSLPAPR